MVTTLTFLNKKTISIWYPSCHKPQNPYHKIGGKHKRYFSNWELGSDSTFWGCGIVRKMLDFMPEAPIM
jgi:hypothetical protein